jgi:hypothetical protein
MDSVTDAGFGDGGAEGYGTEGSRGVSLEPLRHDPGTHASILPTEDSPV